MCSKRPANRLSVDDFDGLCQIPISMKSEKPMQVAHTNGESSTCGSELDPNCVNAYPETDVDNRKTNGASSSKDAPSLPVADDCKDSFALPPDLLTNIEDMRKDLEGSLNVPLNSMEGITTLLLLNLRETSTLAVAVGRLEEQVEELNRCVNSAAHQMKLAPLSSRLDYEQFCKDLQNHEFRLDVVNFLSRCGGKNVTDAVSRMIDALLEHSMQGQFNRTGIHGKLRFGDVLEPLIKDAVLIVVPSATQQEVEWRITNYLKHHADRNGGRQKRRELALKRQSLNMSDCSSPKRKCLKKFPNDSDES